MKKKEAIQYILSVQGFVPYFMMINAHDDNEEIPQELIDLCTNKISESDIKLTNPELSKAISDG